MVIVGGIGDLLLGILACHMAASMIVSDNGPADIFYRTLLFFSLRRNNNFVFKFLADVLSCIKCLSIWIALLLLITYSLNRTIYQFIVIPLSAGWFVVMIEDYRYMLFQRYSGREEDESDV